MGSLKSLDEIQIIAALLRDVSHTQEAVFNRRACRLTTEVVKRRARKEGLSFITKTMPRLCKGLDKALAGDTPLNARDYGFKTMVNSKLPKFLGEFFSRVLASDGTILPDPCVDSVMVIRQVLLTFGKYELPYTSEQESEVVQKFLRTEEQLVSTTAQLDELFDQVLADITNNPRRSSLSTPPSVVLVRRARRILSDLFSSFDPKDIFPRHGPGAVSTRERLWNKYLWSNVSAKIRRSYPVDEYYYVNARHVADRLSGDSLGFNQEIPLTACDNPARVVLVPKDSRGPRLISCEPVDYQWIQQGLGQAIVDLVESHPLTKENVRFTDQTPNQFGALYGSIGGRYATLDLNEASDRVSLSLVRLLFPPHIYEYLANCRSSSTQLPDGMILPLYKFAPMGSCLCFPVLALTVWVILTAAAHGIEDADVREDVVRSIYVYGDDVIVPSAFAGDAIEQLESFGLKVNRDKSCTRGLFRESCGCDAFKGVRVQPVRIRTVWSSTPSPDVYTSWISYANSFYDKRYRSTYDYIVAQLHAVYGAIPDDGMNLSCPSLRVVDEEKKPRVVRTNPHGLQKREWKVWVVKSPSVTFEIDGWAMLLRYFTEFGKARQSSLLDRDGREPDYDPFEDPIRLSVLSYTRRKTSMLVKRWR